MCNLYSMTRNQDAIRAIARAMRNGTGNLPPLPAIFPDYSAPIVRTGADGVRELVNARWGMPSSQLALFVLGIQSRSRGRYLVRAVRGPTTRLFRRQASEDWIAAHSARVLPNNGSPSSGE
jgi:putative SOS response-associated peptidase YedK